MDQRTVDRAATGEARWWLGGLAVILAGAGHTGGALSVIEVTAPPGERTPLHVHHREDETFYVIEGSVTIEVGDARVELGPGGLAVGPRDVPHRYTAGPEGCRMLFICTPGGFEGFVRATSVPAPSRTLPPAAGEPDVEALMVAAAAAGCEVLAP
ncbi:cupin domain-containing protein [Miltoncostaea oceani]|uniref:cupin domain-containing protein n=1 Tax=Miltoncostaea oceani TaxID=2843216 RepID=UPI001C3C571A|nr:cupin domain-containing protein [Miltoncostaea oceani]